MNKILQLAVLALFPLPLCAKPVALETVPPQDTLRVDTLDEIVVKWFTIAKLQIKVSAMGHGFRGVEFGGYKSVMQCIRLSMWQYTNVKRQIEIKTC